MPNFWYRRGKVRFEFRDEKGRMRSLYALPKEAQDEILANMKQVTDRMAMADIGAVLKFLDGEPVEEGPEGHASAIASAGGCRSRPRRNIRSISAPPPACTARRW